MSKKKKLKVFKISVVGPHRKEKRGGKVRKGYPNDDERMTMEIRR